MDNVENIGVIINATEKSSDSPPIPSTKVALTRVEAYTTLAEIAAFLSQLEPHSPVPYLVKLAIKWGDLNTAELYQELFIRLNGQLNIFEMLGCAEIELVTDATDKSNDTSPLPITKTIYTRAEAYTTLAETAVFLSQLEPHSPVPYLAKRAVEWGGLNTAELYQELFIRLNGQLNIFELMGLEAEKVVHE